MSRIYIIQSVMLSSSDRSTDRVDTECNTDIIYGLLTGQHQQNCTKATVSCVNAIPTHQIASSRLNESELINIVSSLTATSDALLRHCECA